MSMLTSWHYWNAPLAKNIDPDDSFWTEAKVILFAIVCMVDSGFIDFTLKGDALNVIDTISCSLEDSQTG